MQEKNAKQVLFCTWFYKIPLMPFSIQVNVHTGNSGYKYNEVLISNEDLITTTMEQLPVTTFAEVLGTVGGLLGLWLGASMLTLLEFMEFFATLAYRIILKMFKATQNMNEGYPIRRRSVSHGGMSG